MKACAAPAGEAASAQQSKDAEAWQSAVEQGPLYAAAITSSPLAGCQWAWDVDGQITLKFQFRDGSTLWATRSPAIEYSEQSLRIGAKLPASLDPLTLLPRAERAAFGADGCGIDWRKAAIEPVEGENGITEAVYRGETCNCQARVRRDAQGQVRGLLLRSVC